MGTKKKSKQEFDTDIICPKCNKTWGKLKFSYDSKLAASDIRVTAGKKKKFKDGDTLACTLCNHEYTNWDVYLAIAEATRNATNKAG